MHCYNGNPLLRLNLDNDILRAHLEIQVSELLPSLTYSRAALLKIRDQLETEDNEVSLPILQTTTPEHQVDIRSAKKQKPRSGRRIRIKNKDGHYINFKARPIRRTPVIQEFNTKLDSQSPPPRGAPGPPNRDNEECAPIDEAKGFPRNTSERRYRRRAYRCWCRELAQVRGSGLGPPSSASSQPKQASQSRASWFRHSLYWQEHHKRRKKGRPPNLPTTTPLKYGYKFRFGSLNVQGFSDTLKLKNCLQLMKEHKLDVLFLTETKSVSYYSYLSEQHMVILSGNHYDKNAGVGVIISPHIRPHLLDVLQVSPRLLQVTFKKKGGNIHLVGAYAPHSGLDFDSIREPSWDQLEAQLCKIPQPEPVYVTGDFNVRFQAQHRNDEGVTGPFTFGKGTKYIDHNATSNRSLCVKAMKLQGMVEVASYKTPNPTQHITYRDKAAPPKDWEQFLLDPLPLQQVYDKLHFTMQEHSVEVAANIRSFLDLPDLLPAPKIAPQIDPVRFQRLDHTFTRKQWLNSICSCQSKLHTGFPSDHYLLVTDFRVRLEARRPKPPKPPFLAYNKLTEHGKKQFNEMVREMLSDPTLITTPLTSERPEKKGQFFTDGSGSSGKCTSRTKAGWGWTTKIGDNWKDAYGPVITDPDHNAYRGAGVGSNNTGEVTAIIEALMYAYQNGYTQVNIRSDSQWAINAITGKWKTKHHKELIAFAKSLVKLPQCKVTLHWVKAHAGIEGNERADSLANKGRVAESRTGTTAATPENPKEFSLPVSTTQEWQQTLKEAAQQTFHKKTTTRSRPWISDATLEALAMARTAEAEGAHEAKTLRNAAKRSARRDRVAWVHEQLLQDPQGNHLHFWKIAKLQKAGFKPRRNHLVVDGKPVPWSRSHEAFRDHLQNRQWKNRNNEAHLEQLNSRAPVHPTIPDTQPFSLEELEAALQKLKKHKAPGPDHNANELFMILDEDNRRLLLSYYNDIWETGEAPPAWKEALVISIFKGKGSDADLGNYRPISLLNTIYKIFAAMLQTRLATLHEAKLRPTQYGFRGNRGTKHPLFILRRAMEWSDATSTPLHLLFLDWKQAFDSIDHNAMLIALQRFGLSERALKIITSLYTNATFFTKNVLSGEISGSVGSGIRQGCPLSPYLFIMVLTVILEDVDWSLLGEGVATNTWSVLRPVYDLEYADDTLLLSLTTTQMQSILTALEGQADLYGMHLNCTKTEMLRDPKGDHNSLYFRDGSPVPTTTQTKYLGSMISWIDPFQTALKHRAALAEVAYKKLRLVWNSNLSYCKKLHIFQSVFISILIYGMDSFTLTDKYIKKIDAVYYRFLRRIVGIKASFYSRVSNNDVWRRAQYPQRPSDRLSKLQFTMLKDVFQAPMEDPLHNVVFSSAYRDRIQVRGRHRGRRKAYWLETTTQVYFPHAHSPHPGSGILGPNLVYAQINRDLDSTGQAPMRARQRARR